MKQCIALVGVVSIIVALSTAGRASSVSSHPEPAIIDTLTFGDTASELAHGVTTLLSGTIRGGLGEPARTLVPKASPAYEGGSLFFTLKIDPEMPNYFTVRLWGSDRTNNRLILYCEGKQVGYRYLGDVDVLDTGNGSPACDGRFFYETAPLPINMTKGRTQLHFEIRGTGPVWGYASNFEQYQKPMAGPTRGIYRVYTHTCACFVPPADEMQGSPPSNPPILLKPGEEVIQSVKDRVNGEIERILKDSQPPNQHQLWFLARAYQVKWTAAYENPKVVQKAVQTLDSTFVAYRKDPNIAQFGPSIYNAGWFGLGPAACAVSLLADPLRPFLDGKVAGAADTGRRDGWTEMFVACRDWHREHRRQYSNQSMINDTYGIYEPNRAIAILNPGKALPEMEVRHYLYQSVGIEPWLGSEEHGVPLRPLGDHYFQLTAKGLTRELGFVGYYGEVLDWMTSMYDATRPAPGLPGDERIKTQLVKAARARAVFRYPALDNDGYRAMRAEAVVGWRDEDHYPGQVTYGQRPTLDAPGIGAAAATLDPWLVGYAKQMLADNQFFASVQNQAKEDGLRVTAGLLKTPDDSAIVNREPPSAERLPMTPGQPDFVFSDEEDGVVAVKNKGEILYASLYWRARFGINGLARVHYIVPAFDRIAVVREETKFDASGFTYTRPDWINMAYGGGGPQYPGEVHSAEAGERLPIAKVPAGIEYRPGDENPQAGKGTFYTLHYGPYLIAMNMAEDRTYECKIPADVKEVKELTEGRSNISADSIETVGPRSTRVFYLVQ